MSSSFSEMARSWTKCQIMDEKRTVCGTNKGRSWILLGSGGENSLPPGLFASSFIPSIIVVTGGPHWCQRGLSHKEAVNNPSLLQGLPWSLIAYPKLSLSVKQHRRVPCPPQTSQLFLLFPLLDPTHRRCFSSPGVWRSGPECDAAVGSTFPWNPLKIYVNVEICPNNSQVYLTRKELV